MADAVIEAHRALEDVLALGEPWIETQEGGDG
jgi:hypothetical protein